MSGPVTGSDRRGMCLPEIRKVDFFTTKITEIFHEEHENSRYFIRDLCGSKKENPMNPEYIVCLLIAGALLLYLVYALLEPEKF